MSAAEVLVESSTAADPLERALVLAAKEGLEANVERWLRFSGVRESDVVELQALNVLKGRFLSTRVAHASNQAEVLRLLAEAKSFDCPGIYFVANRVDPAVASRLGLNKWTEIATKGTNTTDNDITARRVLFVDVDATRARGTSATHAELAAAVQVATQVRERLGQALGGAGAIGYGSSGNGRGVYVALDDLVEANAGPRIRAVLVALDLLFSTPAAKIDRSVSDAKRLVPVPGTMKRKGAAGFAERPHRMTSFTCADSVRRAGLADLDRLLDDLRRELDDAGRLELDKALGVTPAKAKLAPTAPSNLRPFERANAVDTDEVLTWLGLREGERPRCPGCGESDAGVAVVADGLKCSHARCASKGYSAGFRTPVDLVAETRNVEPREAVNLMAERFGFEGFPEAATPANDAPARPRTPAYVIEHAAEIAQPLPPLQWICKGLRIARGSLTLIAGYGYSRKTLAMQSVALSVASGKNAFDLFATERVNVLHVDLEQGHRITRERYQRLARASGIDLQGSSLNVVTFPRFRLSDADAREVVRRLLEESGAGLVIVDSLRASVRGVDENSSEIREYLDLLGEQVKRVDAGAIVLHHARKPSAEGKGSAKYTLRGSSAIFDAADGVFVFSGEKGDATTVDHEKDRLVGVELDSFALDSEDVEHENDPRWGLRVVHLEREVIAERARARAAEVDASSHRERIAKIAAFMLALPSGSWRGTRTALAKQLGGKHAATMAAIGFLVSSGKLIESEKEGLRWLDS